MGAMRDSREANKESTAMTEAREVYRIMSAVEWEAARATGKFLGGADDLRDGFIHLSARAQVAGTLARHYTGRLDLLVIAVAVDRLASGLRWEISRGGELFPHLYGPLPVAAVTDASPAAHWRA